MNADGTLDFEEFKLFYNGIKDAAAPAPATGAGQAAAKKLDEGLKDVISKYKIPKKKVAIELNKRIINKRSLQKIKIKNLDKIEIVHFIGGG